MNDSLNRIRAAPLEDLRSVDYVQYELLPALGLADDSPALLPPAMHRFMGGLRSWQYPCQFAPYLVALSGLGIESYMEIGVRHGGTFIITVEYLNRFSSVPVRGLAMDMNDCPALREYCADNPDCEFVRIDSHAPAAAEAIPVDGFDLVLIDGDHSEDGFLADIELVRDWCTWIALHDADNQGYPWIREYWLNSLERVAGYFGQELTDERHGGIGLMRVSWDK